MERLAEQLERMVKMQEALLQGQSRINQHLMQLAQKLTPDLPEMDQWVVSLLDPPSADLKNSLRVLVVEDDSACQRLVSNYLHHLGDGYQAIPAQDAHEALRLLTALGTARPNGIQLVLMDVQLPGGLDGTQAACLIHAAHPQLPIIPMTSLIGPWDRARYRASGMQETILAKPFSRQGLQEVIIKEIFEDEQ